MKRIRGSERVRRAKEKTGKGSGRGEEKIREEDEEK